VALPPEDVLKEMEVWNQGRAPVRSASGQTPSVYTCDLNNFDVSFDEMSQTIKKEEY
jgi:hypothetical protein